MPNLEFFTLYRRRTAEKLSPLSIGTSGIQCHCTYFDIERHFNRSLFLSFTRSSPILQRPMRSGLVGIVYQVGCRPRVAPPPELGDRRWQRGCKPDHVHWWSTLARLILVHPGDVHFSQDHCPPRPILNPIALQWSEWAERALIQQRKMPHLQSISNQGYPLQVT